MAKSVSSVVGGKWRGNLSVNKRLAKIENLKSASANIGYLENETYDDGTPVGQVAFWQEYGTKTAPARPTFRPLIAQQKKAWADQMVKYLWAGRQPLTIMKLMGEKISGQLKLAIRDTPQKPLSPVTLMLRKMRDEGATITAASIPVALARIRAGEAGATGTRAKALVDTATMLSAPSYEVFDK